jgi:RNA polymerase sigma-70 factor (ECF subfamily)
MHESNLNQTESIICTKRYRKSFCSCNVLFVHLSLVVVALCQSGQASARYSGFAAFPAFSVTSESNSMEPLLSPSDQGTSTAPQARKNSQLPTSDGVETDVSTAALDPGMLMAAAPQGAGGFSPALSGVDTDAEIMLRAKAGDQSAFEYLVQKYRRPMVSFMYRMARNAAAAEDLAQEVFLRVYRSRQNYEASAKFTTWLYRIATNLAVNHARDTRHERPEVQVSLDEPDEESGTTLEVPDGALTAEQAMVRRERMLAIRKKVEALPEQQRLAVIMHKYQQMDYKQIAEVLKKSESATKSLLFRAYETLRDQLKEFI